MVRIFRRGRCEDEAEGMGSYHHKVEEEGRWGDEVGGEESFCWERKLRRRKDEPGPRLNR